MTKTVRAVSEAGYSTTAEAGEFELTIDATGEETPDTIDTLLADYAACYVPALRVGGEQRGVDDLGEIGIDVTGEVDDDGKLTAVAFDVSVDATVDAETAERIVERADALCKVHDALKPALHADVTLSGA